MEVIRPNENEKYEDYIARIPRDRDMESYYETHHILPRCMGGKDLKSNLIKLYPSEHYFAHMLLAKENPDNQSYQYAWKMMSKNRGKDVTEEDYTILRKNLSDHMKEYNRVKNTKEYLSSNERFKWRKKAIIKIWDNGDYEIFPTQKYLQTTQGHRYHIRNVKKLCDNQLFGFYWLYDYVELTNFNVPYAFDYFFSEAKYDEEGYYVVKIDNMYHRIDWMTDQSRNSNRLREESTDILNKLKIYTSR